MPLVARVQFPGLLSEWKERTDIVRLSSDLHKCTAPRAPPPNTNNKQNLTWKAGRIKLPYPPFFFMDGKLRIILGIEKVKVLLHSSNIVRRN